ncbi:MAG: nitroreductase family protein [Firmicutes bacterium]|nr:nitroreductase family protein [Bacillota bacterium]
MNETIKLLLSHSSCRSFLDKPVPEEVAEAIIKCAQRAPTSSYLQAYTIIRVEDKEKRKLLAEYAGGQEWVEKAGLVLLFCADLHRLEVMLDVKDKNVLHNTELYTVAVTDAALASSRALVAAQAMGLGGVFVGGVRNETEKMAELFELPQMVFPMYAVCMGYPDKIPPQRPRMAAKMISAVDGYPDITGPEQLTDYEKEVSEYFLDITNGRSGRGWIARAEHAISVKPRYGVGDFLHKAGFMTADEPAEKSE